MAEHTDDFLDKANRFLEGGGAVRSRDFAEMIVPELASMLLSKASVSPERRQLFKLYLPQLLTFVTTKQNMPMTVANVLGGLYANDCWEDCLANDLQAYSLASALLTYVAAYSDVCALDAVTWHGVCDILNTWLNPVLPWTLLPHSSVVARHMFGEAWCTLFLNEGSTAPRDAAGLLALSERPPFLPGLCAFDTAASDIALPADFGVMH